MKKIFSFLDPTRNTIRTLAKAYLREKKWRPELGEKEILKRVLLYRPKTKSHPLDPNVVFYKGVPFNFEVHNLETMIGTVLLVDLDIKDGMSSEGINIEKIVHEELEKLL